MKVNANRIHIKLPLALVLATAMVLSGCNSVKLATHAAKSLDGPYKVGKPYQVAGVWYYPREQPDYDETGIASWYGPGFHGKITANGETYDQNALTAAHQTLPMPVKVRVTNLENGRSLIVRINDRGPFVNGRVIDVSRRTAQLLGFDTKGTAPVRVQIVDGGGTQGRTFVAAKPFTSDEEKKQVAAAPSAGVSSQALPGSVKDTRPQRAAPRPPLSQLALAPSPAPVAAAPVVELQPIPPTRNIFVQAGAFRDPGNAYRLKVRLASFVPGIMVSPIWVSGHQLFRVRVGPISSVAAADAMLGRVVARGVGGAHIVID